MRKQPTKVRFANTNRIFILLVVFLLLGAVTFFVEPPFAKKSVARPPSTETSKAPRTDAADAAVSSLDTQATAGSDASQQASGAPNEDESDGKPIGEAAVRSSGEDKAEEDTEKANEGTGAAEDDDSTTGQNGQNEEGTSAGGQNEDESHTGQKDEDVGIEESTGQKNKYGKKAKVDEMENEDQELNGEKGPFEEFLEAPEQVNARMELVKRLAKAQDENPFGKYALIQFLDRHFVDMTKHWICNMERFPSVLKTVTFIATDEQSYNQLVKFKPSLNVVRLELKRANPNIQYKFGQLGYFEFVLFRTKFLVDLLKSGVSFFLTEADSYWARNVLEEIKEEYKDSDFDMLIASDRYLDGRVQGGFQWQRATETSIKAWDLVYRRQLSKIAAGHRKHGIGSNANMGNHGNEQRELSNILEKEREGVPIKELWLPRTMVSSGLWYEEKWATKYKHLKEPSVVLMNFSVGNEAKRRRAIKFGHYFHDQQADECIVDPQPRGNMDGQSRGFGRPRPNGNAKMHSKQQMI